MRLIEAEVLVEEGRFSFVEFPNGSPSAYAILSHCWVAGQEITFKNCDTEAARHLSGYDKVLQTCKQALMHEPRIHYVWVDTCCIDKSSSAELSQAINSMFAWYRDAERCYVFLADIPNKRFKGSRWFERGWTLQELIAPKSITFFNGSWQRIGSKTELLEELTRITRVSGDVLCHERPLSSTCVAQRLSWAANRKTTRVEDEAYCLLGILEINMPPLYGEGRRAFYRLQEEIVRSTYDLSILAWTPSDPQAVGDYCGFFAQSAADFATCSTTELIAGAALDDIPMSMSNRGVEILLPEYIVISDLRSTHVKSQYALKLNCKYPNEGGDLLTITMRKIGPNVFLRTRWVDKDSFAPLPMSFSGAERQAMVLLTRLPETRVPEGRDIVSSSRHTQVDFIGWVPGETSLQAPNKAWDMQDHAFFGTGTSLENWGSISFGRVYFVFLWHRMGREGDDWDFEGFLLDRHSHDFAETVWEELFQYEKRQALYVKQLLEDVPGRMQGALEYEDSGAVHRVSFKCQPHRDPDICTGPRWVVKLAIHSH